MPQKLFPLRKSPNALRKEEIKQTDHILVACKSAHLNSWLQYAFHCGQYGSQKWSPGPCEAALPRFRHPAMQSCTDLAAWTCSRVTASAPAGCVHESWWCWSDYAHSGFALPMIEIEAKINCVPNWTAALPVRTAISHKNEDSKTKCAPARTSRFILAIWYYVCSDAIVYLIWTSTLDQWHVLLASLWEDILWHNPCIIVSRKKLELCH